MLQSFAGIVYIVLTAAGTKTFVYSLLKILGC